MIPLLAAIKAAPDAAPDPATPVLRDIAPPVAIPYPLWQVVLFCLLAATLLALLGWVFWRWWPRAEPTPPPSPRQVALAALEKLRPQVRTEDPHRFSFAVSDVLRRFLEAQFGARALEQTTDEFLAEIARSARFSPGDRKSLSHFLERSDMIKFARQGADESASEALFASALTFVQGGRAQ